MKINNLSFRDIDRKWFCIENKEQIKKICKKLWLDKTDKPLLLYAFIEYEKGIRMRIVGNIYFENNLEIDKEFLEYDEFIDYDFFKEFDFIKIDDNIVSNIKYTKEIEEQMNKYYSNQDLIETRNIENIDNCRDKIIIDRINFLLINKNIKQENVNGIIVGLNENKDIICKILDKPKKDFKLKKGDLIILKYLERPKFKGLVYIGKYEKK